MDAAYEHHWGKGALLSISASTRRIRDYTLWEVMLENSRWVNSPRNMGNATTHGLELEIKFPLRSVFATATDIDVRASVSRNWSKVDAVPGPENRVAGQTPLSATVGVDYKRGSITTGGSFAYQRDDEARFARNQTAFMRMPRSLDAYVLWTITPQTQLRLAASNLLGEDEVARSSYTDEDGNVLLRGVTWGLGPTMRATLEMKF